MSASDSGGSIETILREIVAAELRHLIAGLRDVIRADFRAELEAERAARPPERLDVVRAAQRLGVSIATIRRRVKDGSLPVFRVGRRVLVEVGAVQSSKDLAETSRRTVANSRHALALIPGRREDR